MIFLKQSTASQEVPLGYFVDSTDGNTEETGLTIANTDIKVWKTGATTLANKNSGGATHISNGIYYAVLDATDTDTLGPLVIFVHVSGALTVRLECCVLAANVYDSLVGATDKLDVNTAEIAGSNVSTSTAQIGVNVVNAAGTAWASGAITSGVFGSGAITAAAIAADAIGASELAADAVTEIAAGVWNSARATYTSAGSFGEGVASVQGNVTGSVGSVTSGVTVTTNNDKTGYSLTQSFPTNFSSLAITGGGAVTTGSLSANAITAASITDGAITAAKAQGVVDYIEYQRGGHTATGSTFYVDGVAGDDSTGDGSRGAPYKTISKALTVCTSNAHDCILLLPNSAGDPTTITESATISVTKNYVQIRGTGRDMNVTLNTSGSVFSIAANGVQLHGMRITTFSGGGSDGVNINSAVDFVSVRRCWIENAHRDAVQINVATDCIISDCQLTTPGRDGVRVSSGAGSGYRNKVLDCVIRNAGGVGIGLQGSDASYCRIQGNTIRNCATAIEVSSGAVNSILTDNRLGNNTTNLSDSGTGTFHEFNTLATNVETGRIDVGYAEGVAWSSGAITAASLAADAGAEIADAVWDEALSGHTTAGSAGKALSDAGAAGDPWGTAVPGAYGAGTAGYILGTNVDTTISSRSTLTAAAVNTEVVDALNTDTYAEPGSGAPGATISLAQKIGYLYKAFRNKVTQTSTEYTLYADDESTAHQKATVSDDGTTFTRGEVGGP